MHTATAERLGVSGALIRQLVEGDDDAGGSEKMRPVLALARKVTDDPAGVTTADADAVFAAGWNDTAFYHAIAVTALFNFMNRLVEGMGIELDPAYVEPASKRLADRGYLPLIEMLRG